MTQAEDEALHNALHVVGVANAVQDAMEGDVLRTAKGLVCIAQVLARDNTSRRTSLAGFMMKTARELAPHLRVACLPRVKQELN
jgi:hypothetical protein